MTSEDPEIELECERTIVDYTSILVPRSKLRAMLKEGYRLDDIVDELVYDPAYSSFASEDPEQPDSFQIKKVRRAPVAPRGENIAEINPFSVMQNIPVSTGKEKQPHSASLIYQSKEFSGRYPVIFHEVEVDQPIELEGKKLTLGPSGKEVEVKQPKQYSDNGKPIDKKQTKEILRYPDGEEEPYFDLPATKTFNISENRPLSEITLDPSDPSVSFGTCIPRTDVAKWAVERVQDIWEPLHGGLRSLAERLEKEKLAMAYPFSFGRGRKLYVVLAYPERLESKLYMLGKFSPGMVVYNHPLEAPADAPQATTAENMPLLRIRNKAKASSSQLASGTKIALIPASMAPTCHGLKILAEPPCSGTIS